MNWIAVEDRLPDIDDDEYSADMLVWDGAGAWVVYYCVGDWWTDLSPDFPMKDVTHWSEITPPTSPIAP